MRKRRKAQFTLFGDGLESEVLKDVRHYLDAREYVWWRNHTQGVYRGKGKFSRNDMAGFPDLSGIFRQHPGRLWTCELKRESGGKIDALQRAWQARLVVAGVYAFFARSRDEFHQHISQAERSTQIVLPDGIEAVLDWPFNIDD